MSHITSWSRSLIFGPEFANPVSGSPTITYLCVLVFYCFLIVHGMNMNVVCVLCVKTAGYRHHWNSGRVSALQQWQPTEVSNIVP